jgi:PPOX class probable F420-dependent enzyme
MDQADARAHFAAARVAHLATVDARGRPRIVPCCFALRGDTAYSAVDAKPKSTLELARLDAIRAHPEVALLVDHYDDRDWSRLWWVRVDARAGIVPNDSPEREVALDLLAAKYEQYRDARPPGAVIKLEIVALRSWP